MNIIFDSIDSLAKELLLFRRYKNIPMFPRVLFLVLASPLFALFFILFGIYKAIMFIFNLFKSPADYLYRFIKDEGEKVKHVAYGVIIYFFAFPIAFILIALSALLVPILLIIYLLLNCVAYCYSLGDTKFNVYAFNKVDRDLTKKEKIEYKEFYWINLGVLLAVKIAHSVLMFVGYNNQIQGLGTIEWSLFVIYICAFAFINFSLHKKNKVEVKAKPEPKKQEEKKEAPKKEVKKEPIKENIAPENDEFVEEPIDDIGNDNKEVIVEAKVSDIKENKTSKPKGKKK